MGTTFVSAMRALWGSPLPQSPLEIDVTARRAALDDFVDLYEDLVETVCDAANFGDSTKFEAKFARALPKYRNGLIPVHRFLEAFMADCDEDAFEWFGKFQTLQELLRADDGNLIGRIMETRAAMNDYAEHLQRLSANRE